MQDVLYQIYWSESGVSFIFSFSFFFGLEIGKYGIASAWNWRSTPKQSRMQDFNFMGSGCHWTNWLFELVGSKFYICTYLVDFLTYIKVWVNWKKGTRKWKEAIRTAETWAWRIFVLWWFKYCSLRSSQAWHRRIDASADK